LISLILAAAIWTVIRAHLVADGTWEDEVPKKALPVSDDERRAIEGGDP
jgi:hypothetical protein